MNQKRIERLISSASVCHMNNAKWRKLFSILRDPSTPARRLNYKFVGTSKIYRNIGIPSSQDLLETKFGDILPHPYGEYREIEWIEIPSSYPNPKSDPKRPLPEIKHDLVRIKKSLDKHGQFPIQLLDSGLRIVAYTWL